MHVNTSGKVQRSAAEWRAIIERYEQSGLGATAFCTQEGIALHSFKKRYYHHKRATRPAAAFVDLTPAVTPSAAAWELELRLPNGVRLELRG